MVKLKIALEISPRIFWNLLKFWRFIRILVAELKVPVGIRSKCEEFDEILNLFSWFWWLNETPRLKFVEIIETSDEMNEKSNPNHKINSLFRTLRLSFSKKINEIDLN